jgi:hypothetical protein
VAPREGFAQCLLYTKTLFRGCPATSPRPSGVEALLHAIFLIPSRLETAVSISSFLEDECGGASSEVPGLNDMKTSPVIANRHSFPSLSARSTAGILNRRRSSVGSCPVTKFLSGNLKGDARFALARGTSRLITPPFAQAAPAGAKVD